MFRSKRRVTAVAVAVLGGVALVGAASGINPAHDGRPSVELPSAFTGAGELIRPKDYRTRVFIGCPLTPNELNGGHAPFPEFHNVYLDPTSYELYKHTGEFRDGAIIVKELVSVGPKSSLSGKGYFEGEYLGLEAMIRSKERFPREPGNWGCFRFTDEEAAAEGRRGAPRDVASAASIASCATSHTGAAQDYVFTQRYPVLRAARSAKQKPENR